MTHNVVSSSLPVEEVRDSNLVYIHTCIWYNSDLLLVLLLTHCDHICNSDLLLVLLLTHCDHICNSDLFTVFKELRSKMFGQHPGYFKAVFLKQTRIIIVSIYKYTVYIMF